MIRSKYPTFITALLLLSTVSLDVSSVTFDLIKETAVSVQTLEDKHKCKLNDKARCTQARYRVISFSCWRFLSTISLYARKQDCAIALANEYYTHTHTHRHWNYVAFSLSAVHLFPLINRFKYYIQVFLPQNYLSLSLSFLWRCDPARVMASSFLRFLDHTQRQTSEFW
jgi:hypothetical protein